MAASAVQYEKQSDLFSEEIISRAKSVFELLKLCSEESAIDTINELKLELHKYSPFAKEPVDCVVWIRASNVTANDYNPNSVAPPEMKLLEHSITEDGYTQPIVSWFTGDHYEVVDGFHRNRVSRECKVVRDRIKGYLPLTVINSNREDRNDRIASTIRHNRARGKHQVQAMSDIVVELKRRNWSEDRIGRELGMEADEVLRLCQISGLSELFHDQEFSKSWDVEGEITESDFEELTDEVEFFGEETSQFRTVNTSDPTRIFHTYHNWECYKAGFYNNFPPAGLTKTQCEESYATFLREPASFAGGLEGVIGEWKHSCEHYLTNTSMNRIAWMGQAAMCHATGIPSAFRSGFHLLSEAEQKTADELALKYLNRWMETNGRGQLTMEEAYSGERQSDIY